MANSACGDDMLTISKVVQMPLATTCLAFDPHDQQQWLHFEQANQDQTVTPSY
jgi:hypothetical protein